MLAFHGTSLQNALKIWNEGFNFQNKNWLPSEDYVYAFLDKNSNGFQLALNQACTSTFKEEALCKRASVIIDLQNLLYEEDITTMPKDFLSVKIKDVPISNIKAIYADKINLEYYRDFVLYHTFQKLSCSTFRPTLTSEQINRADRFNPKEDIIPTDIEEICSRNIYFRPPNTQFYL